MLLLQLLRPGLVSLLLGQLRVFLVLLLLQFLPFLILLGSQLLLLLLVLLVLLGISRIRRGRPLGRRQISRVNCRIPGTTLRTRCTRATIFRSFISTTCILRLYRTVAKISRA